MHLSPLSLIVIATLATPIAVMFLSVTNAQIMSSSNFQIHSDSVNTSGGFSSSSNYAIEATTGEVSSGDSDSSNYSLRAGFQQMQEVYMAMTVSSSSVGLAPNIPGISGGVSNGSTTVTVTTDSLSGYQLTIMADADPAMQKGSDTIADYIPSGGVPDYTFSTLPADSHLGYTPEGSDVAQRFLNSGTTCNAGSSNDTASCWDGLSTTQTVIAQSSGSNHPNGTDTSVRFRVGVGGSSVQAPGVYVATTTLTALAL